MGNWNITIQGIGPHHNKVKDHQESQPNGGWVPDQFGAEEIAKRFVFDLRRHGQVITSATFTHGGADNLLRKSLRPSNSEDSQCVVCGTSWCGPGPLPKACPSCAGTS